ncbi:MAG: hypothetical protein DSY37_01955 [Hyperthermus sp.]|nr:MAG: hypothetical protein DSY37_01955 [Hyperthermus sp.]
MAVEIVWHLHSCIELIAGGKSLLIDPHDGGSLGVGFTPPTAKPDYILVTHEHYDHNAVNLFSAKGGRGPLIIREREGSFELPPFRVKGVKLPHDEFEGRLRGFVVAYKITVEGLSLAHLSDLGRPLRDQEAREFGSVDIVFAPVGGVYTLPPSKVIDVVDMLDAKIIIPIHYWLPGVQLPLEPLDVFINHARNFKVLQLEDNRVVIDKHDLPGERTILVLQPPGRRRS